VVGALTLLISATVLAWTGCSPVYVFRRPVDDRLDRGSNSMRKRLHALLSSRGFRAIGRSDRATGDIGCGRSAPDRTTFEKGWRDTGVLGSDHWVWVHEFSCKDTSFVVIVSSTNAEREAAKLRDTLLAEFARESASGTLRVVTRHRFALE